MRARFVSIIVIIGLATAFAVAPLPAQAKTGTWVGTVTHVSVDNLKVADKGGHELSFLIVPKFKNVWSTDGKTTYQMSALHPGTMVKVIYDQKALGARHADKIIVIHF